MASYLASQNTLMAEKRSKKMGLLWRLLLVAIGGVLLLFLVISAYLSATIRSSVRWAFHAADYKAKVLAQPSPRDGSLKHMEWDGWGFPGAGDMTMYLVFDPHNSLSQAAISHSSVKVTGLPCEVPTVRRLEDRWYTVMFYSETDWDHCH
jgi:hypothetical protein